MMLFLSISNRLGGVETSLANLTARLEPVFNQYYQPFKKVAEEKGYENAALLPVNLDYTDVPIDHPPQSDLKGKTDNLDYELKCSVHDFCPLLFYCISTNDLNLKTEHATRLQGMTGARHGKIAEFQSTAATAIPPS